MVPQLESPSSCDLDKILSHDLDHMLENRTESNLNQLKFPKSGFKMGTKPSKISSISLRLNVYPVM